MSDPWAVVGDHPDAEADVDGGWDVVEAVPVRKRSDLERFAENALDAINRNPTVATLRNAFSNPASAIPMRPGGTLPQGLSPDLFDIPLIGQAAKIGAAGAGALTRALGVEAPPMMDAQAERERRGAFEAQSAADPFYTAPGGVPAKARAGAATLAGQLAGAVTDPQNLIGPGRTAARRIAAAAGINASGDLQAQQADVAADIQDEWSPVQTLAATGLGAVIQGGQEAAGPAIRAARPHIEAAGRAVAEAVGRIAEAPIPSRATDLDGWEVVAAEPTARRPEAEALGVDQARAIIDEILPGGTHTSGYRNPAKNKAVGGAPNSYHTRGKGQATDLVPPQGADIGAFRGELSRRLDAQGLRLAELIDEGDHWHIAWEPKAGTPRERLPDGRRFTADDLEAMLAADEPAAPQSAGPAPRPAPDGQRAEPAAEGAEPGQDLAAGPEAVEPERGDLRPLEHFDDSHARLYELGKKAEAGELDHELANRLAREMAPYMDWSDDDLSRREREFLRQGRGVFGRRMIEVAKDYASMFDQEGGPDLSFYDADLYAEAAAAARRRGEGGAPAPRSAEEDVPIPAEPTARAIERELAPTPTLGRDAQPRQVEPPPAARNPRNRTEREDREIEIQQRQSEQRARDIMGREQTADDDPITLARLRVRDLDGQLNRARFRRERVRAADSVAAADAEIARLQEELTSARAEFDSLARAAGRPGPRNLPLFAGRKARTADRAALARAETMERAGTDPELIRTETGWFRGDDGEWRFEITDHDAPLRETQAGGKIVGVERLQRMDEQKAGVARLDSILDHPRLFDAYPDLRRLEVVVDAVPGLGRMEGRTLILSPRAVHGEPDQLRGVVLHEIQHYIQNREGFAIGAPSSAAGLRGAGYGQALDAAPERLRQQGKVHATPEGDVYRRSAGEIEARNVERRRDLTPDERAAASPEDTRDIPAEDAVVVRVTRQGPAEFPSRAARQDRTEPGPDDRLQTTKGGLRHAPEAKAVPRGEGERFKGETVSGLARKLRVALGLTHRQGRLRGRRALGEYGLADGVVRTKHMHELDVLAHEAAHALEFMKKPPALLKAMKAHAALLKTFDYDPDAARRHEGFAEWFRWYVTNPDVARKMAPKFYEDFEAAMREDLPEAFEAIRDIQDAYQALLSSASLDVAAASVAHTGRPGPLSAFHRAISENGLGGAISDLLDKAYTWFVDDLHPIARAERRLLDIDAENRGGRRRDLKAAGSPYVLARLSREAYAAGRLDAMEGVVPYRGTDPEGPSIADALEVAFGKKPVGDWPREKLDAFDAYLISRRMVHEWDRYEAGQLDRPPDKFPRAYHEQVIADAEAKNSTWPEAARMIYAWNTALWRKELDAGFISPETHAAGLEIQDYVPLQRDVSDKKDAGRPNRAVRGSLQHSGGAKRFRGSTRDVISPLTSMVRRAYELNALIRRNDVIGKLDQLARAAGPGGGAIAERLPQTQVEAVRVNAASAVEALAKAQGLSNRDVSTLVAQAEAKMGEDADITIWRRGRLEPKPGEAVVFHWSSGEPHPILIGDPDLYTAITGMDRQMANALVDTFSGLSSMLRAGITLSPEFQSRNLVRDQLATWVNTDVGVVPGIDFLRGAALSIRGGKTAKRYAAAGGLHGGSGSAALRRPFPRNDPEARRQLASMNPSRANAAVRTFATGRGLVALTDLSESGSRLAVFRKAFEKAKREGLSDYEAVVEAAYTSRDYLDFGRHGSRMLTAVRIVTFLNSQIQSLDKALRVVTASRNDRPNLGDLRRVLAPIGREAATPAQKRAQAHAYKALAKMSAMAVFGAALTQAYMDDPEYQEFTEQERATHWFFKAFGRWWRIPKPFELAEPSNLLERFVEWKIGGDPSAPQKMLKDAFHTLAPPHEITALQVPLEIARNRDFAGRPIIPDHLKDAVDPEHQFNAWTSKFSRKLGEVLNVSPAIIDHVITGYGGSLGRYALQGSDLAIETATGEPRTAAGPEDLFLVRGFASDPARGSLSQEKFWSLVSRQGGKYVTAEGTFRKMMREGDDAGAADYLNGLSPAARGYVLARVLSEDGSSKVHPLVRAQEAVSVLSELRRDIRDDALQTIGGAPIRLTPEQRRRADEAVADLALSEMRNALVLVGETGWAQKDLIPRADAMARLHGIDPRLDNLVRTLQAEQRIPTAGAASRLWRAQRSAYEAEVDPDRLARILAQERLTSGDRKSRREEAIRQLRNGVGP